MLSDKMQATTRLANFAYHFSSRKLKLRWVCLGVELGLSFFLKEAIAGDVMWHSKGGGGEGLLLQIKKSTRVQWQWVIVDIFSLDLACQRV